MLREKAALLESCDEIAQRRCRRMEVFNIKYSLQHGTVVFLEHISFHR